MFQHSLEVGPVAPAEARKLVHDRLERTLSPEALAEAELMTSELVTNAVVHARMPDDEEIEVLIVVGDETTRVSIVDGGEGFDTTQPAPGHERNEGGFGLGIVEEFSARWGVERDPHGVWFEIDHAPTPGRASD